MLNADGQLKDPMPLSLVSWKEAVRYMYTDKCDVLEWYDNWVVCSPSWQTKVPAVILLRSFIVKNYKPRFSRHNILLRDMFTCQYCSKPVTSSTATLDHVIPISRGGKTNFENIVSSCGPCNTAKGSSIDIKPINKPRVPDYYELINKSKRLSVSVKHPSWNLWLSSR